MAFIIPLLQKSRWETDMRDRSPGMLVRYSLRGSISFIPGVVLLGLTLLFAMPAGADNFSVKSVQAYIEDSSLHVDARFDLPFNPRIEEALSKGIPIDVEISVKMVKPRWWWWNHLVTDYDLHRRIQFHALSRQYLVSGLHERDPSLSFSSLTQALAHAGTLEHLKIFLAPKKNIETGARYLIQLRARLDIEALPMLMRPLAYATPSWRRNTGWTEWPIEQIGP
jgi:hypothetical protein